MKGRREKQRIIMKIRDREREKLILLDVAYTTSVSYTHLTLPTNREV